MEIVGAAPCGRPGSYRVNDFRNMFLTEPYPDDTMFMKYGILTNEGYDAIYQDAWDWQ